MNRVLTNPPSSRPWIRPSVLLAGILVLGALFRIYSLGERSFIIDDFLGYATIEQATTFSEYYNGINSRGGHGSLVFYGLAYCWNTFSGADPALHRLLPLVFSVGAIGMLYLLGCRAVGRRTAMLAALFLALAPTFVWQAQYLRPYSMVVFFGLLSAYALVRAVEEKKVHWWCVNIAANIITVYLHLPHGSLLAAEGCFLLWHWRRHWGALLIWSSIQVALLAPWVALVASRNSVNASHVMIFEPSLVADFFTNPGINNFSVPAPTWSEFNPWGGSGQVLHVFWLTCRFLGFILWSMVPVAGFLAFRGRSSRNRGGIALALLLVPPLFLGLLTLSTSLPFLKPRYMLFTYPVAYLVLACVINALPGSWPKRIAALAVTAILTFQLAVFLPGMSNTDWRAAKQHIARHATPQDIVLCASPTVAIGHSFNPPPLGLPVLVTANFQATCDAILFFLDTAEPGARKMWYLLNMNWDPSKLRPLETLLTDHGLTFTRYDLAGHDFLALYEVGLEDDGGPTDAEAIARRLTPDTPLDLTPLLTAGINTGEQSTRNPQDTSLFRRMLPDPPPYDSPVLSAFDLAQLPSAGRMDVTALLVQGARERAELWEVQYSLALWALLQEDEAALKTALGRMADMRTPVSGLLLGSYMETLFVEQNFEMAVEEAQRLERIGQVGAFHLRGFAEYLAHPERLMLPFGIHAHEAAGYNAVLPDLRRGPTGRLHHPLALYTLAETYELMQRHGEAQLLYQECAQILRHTAQTATARAAKDFDRAAEQTEKRAAALANP